MRSIWYMFKEGFFMGLIIVAALCSFFLFCGFTLGLPIILAVVFTPWWLLLLIVTIPIGFSVLSVFANGEDDYI